MNRFLVTRPWLAILATFAMFATALPARADFRIRVDNGTTTGVVVTSGTGVISIGSFSLGGILVNNTGGTSKPINPGAQLHLNNFSVSSGSAGTVRVFIEDTNF